MRTPRPRQTRSRPGSLVPADRHGLDEVLIVTLTIDRPDRGGLAACLNAELFRSNVGHPDLNQAKAPLAHPLPVRPYPVSDSHDPHVTCNAIVGPHSVHYAFSLLDTDEHDDNRDEAGNWGRFRDGVDGHRLALTAGTYIT